MSSYQLIEQSMLTPYDINLSAMGADTVLVGELNEQVLYICAHFKEFKISDEIEKGSIILNAKENAFVVKNESGVDLFLTSKQDLKFITQMVELNKLISHFHNGGWECYVLCDANTQVIRRPSETNILTFYEKEKKKGVYNRVDFAFDFPIIAPFQTESEMLANTTTNKMRGYHTAQLNKSLIPASSNIDFSLYIPRKTHLESNFDYVDVDIGITVYKITETRKLAVKVKHDLTTTPFGISDHAPVITSINSSNTNCVIGTFNIMGGNEDDNGWAEFVPEEYKDFFLSKEVKDKVDLLLLRAFEKYTFSYDVETDESKLSVIKSKNFVSEHRFKICEEHMNPEYVPIVEMNVDDKSIVCSVYTGELCVLKATFRYMNFEENVKNRYCLDNLDVLSKNAPVADITVWIETLLNDLNQYNKKMTQLENMENQMTRIIYFQEKVLNLLNFYADIVQNDDIVYNSKSLKDIYTEWYTKKMRKVTIADTLNKLKIRTPDLKLIAIQEFPTEPNLVEKLCKALEENVGGKLFMNNDLFVIDGKVSATRGAIFVYNDVDIEDPNIFNNPESLITVSNKFPLRCGVVCFIIIGIITYLSWLSAQK